MNLPKWKWDKSRLSCLTYRTPSICENCDTLRDYHKQNYTSWLVSAQPSRSVSLLQEHDCPAQFVPNPRDYHAIDKLQIQHVAVAVKYSGLAEVEGFILPTFRMVLVTDREFFGQQSLASFSYVSQTPSSSF